MAGPPATPELAMAGGDSLFLEINGINHLAQFINIFKAWPGFAELQALPWTSLLKFIDRAFKVLCDFVVKPSPFVSRPDIRRDGCDSGQFDFLRRGRDSHPGERFCRPLPDYSATTPLTLINYYLDYVINQD